MEVIKDFKTPGNRNEKLHSIWYLFYTSSVVECKVRYLRPPTGIAGTCTEMASFHWNTQPSRGNWLKIIHECITAPEHSPHKLFQVTFQLFCHRTFDRFRLQPFSRYSVFHLTAVQNKVSSILIGIQKHFTDTRCIALNYWALSRLIESLFK